MDILISSNLERYLYALSGQNAQQVRTWMDALGHDRRYTVDQAVKSRLAEEMTGGWVGDDEALSNIARVFSEYGAVIDPHTSVASTLLKRYRDSTGDDTPGIVVATASPFKFGRDVARALNINEKDDLKSCALIARLAGAQMPPQIAALADMPIRHTAECAPDSMETALLRAFGG